MDEDELRAHRRRLADGEYGAAWQAPRHQGWHMGLCAGCRTMDLVKGPAEQELCQYCDFLRIAPPLPRRHARVSLEAPFGRKELAIVVLYVGALIAAAFTTVYISAPLLLVLCVFSIRSYWKNN